MIDNNNNETNPPEDHKPQPPEVKDFRALFALGGAEAIKKRLAAAKKLESESKSKSASKEDGEITLTPEEEQAIVDCFYYDGRSYQMIENTQFVQLDRRSVESQMSEFGIKDPRKFINRIQREHNVIVMTGYAGRPAGLLRNGNKLFLIKEGPDIIKPKQGSWATIREVIEALMDDDPEVGGAQVTTLLHWLKFSYEALQAGVRMPGQALVLAGPAGCGKSLLIDLIVVILGGRRGHPHKYITGRTAFNGELMGTEVLVSDDESGSTDIKTRHGVGAAYKSLLFSGQVPIEAKYGTPGSFAPFWRLIIACNDEPESMLVLPPLSTDIADKIILIRCHKRTLPGTSSTPRERTAFFNTLRSEVPALIFDLLSMEVPEELRSSRCGVTHFHHPVLLSSLIQLSPEQSLLHLIDEALPMHKMTLGFTKPWEGTASELRRDLHEFCAIKTDVQKLLSTVPMVGTYLARLANNGTRVERLSVRDGYQRWKIHPPVKDAATAPEEKSPPEQADSSTEALG